MDSSDLFVRYFLAIYFLLVGLGFSSTSYALSQRTGFSHINYGERYSKTWWHRHIFNLFRGTILAVCLVRVVINIDPWLGVFSPLYQPWILNIGVGFMLISYTVTSYVHSYMHQDWRSGIADQQHCQQLIMSGPFARSRNPLFIGILAGQLGFFLALPSAFSLICLIAGMSVIFLQVQAEERALQVRFGEAYTKYQQMVPRWFRT